MPSSRDQFRAISRQAATAPARALRGLWALGPLVRALSAYASIYVAWLLFVPKDDASRPWSSWLVLPISLAAATLSFRASKRSDGESAARRAWAWLTLAFACQLLGDLGWAYVESIRHENPASSWANLPYLLFYIFVPLGLFAFPIAVRSRLDRRVFALDIAAVVVGGGLVTFRSLLLPNLGRLANPESWLPFLYPVGDLVALVGLARLLLRRVVRAPGRSMDLLAASLLLNTAGNTLWAVLESVGGYETGGLAVALRAVSYVMVVAAATAAFAAPVPSAAVEAAPEAGRRSGRVLVGFAGLAYALLVVTAVGTASPPILSISFGVLLLTGLVTTRQLLAARAALVELRARTMEESATVYRSLLRTSTEAILVLEATGEIRSASPSAGPLLGVPADGLVGRDLASLLRQEDESGLQAALHEVCDAPERAPTFECDTRHPGGEARHLECHVTNLTADSLVRGIVVRARDVSEVHAERAALFHRAFHDSLTTLPGRELFLDRLRQALRARGRKAEAVTVMFLDLDGFKAVNDRHGHGAGDIVLQEVAIRLRASLRDGDTAGRLGGDEFALVLDRTNHPEDVLSIARRVTDAIAGPVRVGKTEIPVGASIGVALSRVGETAESLLRRADAAMYDAKRGGGSQAFTAAGEALEAARSVESVT